MLKVASVGIKFLTISLTKRSLILVSLGVVLGHGAINRHRVASGRERYVLMRHVQLSLSRVLLAAAKIGKVAWLVAGWLQENSV